MDYRHIIEWLVRKPGAFENYRYREELFPTGRFHMAWDALREFTPMMDGGKFTFITDSDGNQIELVAVAAGTTAGVFDRIAIGLTISDAEESRAFYRTVLALQEEKPEKLALLNGGSKYAFLAGKTQIEFWKGTADHLPKHTGNITDAIGFRSFTFMV